MPSNVEYDLDEDGLDEPNAMDDLQLDEDASDASEELQMVDETLRFGVGDRVDCNTGYCYEPGTIVRLWYEESTLDEAAPYQIRLDTPFGPQDLIFAKWDTDECLRARDPAKDAAAAAAKALAAAEDAAAAVAARAALAAETSFEGHSMAELDAFGWAEGARARAESEYHYFLALRRAKPLVLARTTAPARVVAALRLRTRFACLYASESLQACFGGEDVSDDWRGAAASFVEAGVVEAAVEAIGGNPFMSARKEACAWMALLLRRYPAAIHRAVDAGLGAALASCAAKCVAGRLRAEINDFQGPAFAAHQTDVLKPYASEEDCCAYAPRYASLCREGCAILAQAACGAAALLRRRAALLGGGGAAAVLALATDRVAADAAFANGRAVTVAAGALAAIVAPSLDAAVAGSADVADVDAALAVLAAADGDAMGAVLGALETLVDEHPEDDFLRVVARPNPYAHNMGFPAPAMDNDKREDAARERRAAIPALADCVASLLASPAGAGADRTRVKAVLRRVLRGEGYDRVDLVGNGNGVTLAWLFARVAAARGVSSAEVLLEHQQVALDEHLTEIPLAGARPDPDDPDDPADRGLAYLPAIDRDAALVALSLLEPLSDEDAASARAAAARLKDLGGQCFDDDRKVFRIAAGHYARAACLADAGRAPAADVAVLLSNFAEASLRSGAPRRALAAAEAALALGGGGGVDAKSRVRRDRARRAVDRGAPDAAADLSAEPRRLDAAIGARAAEARISRAEDPTLRETDEDRDAHRERIDDTEGEDEIIVAGLQGNTRVVKRRLREGADANTRNTMTQETPLMHAACYGHLDVAEVLLAHGACARTTDWRGQDALAYAERAHKNKDAMVALLRDARDAQGPDPITPDGVGGGCSQQ